MSERPSRAVWTNTDCPVGVQVNEPDEVVLSSGIGTRAKLTMSEAHQLHRLLGTALEWWRAEQAEPDDDVVDVEIVGTVCSGQADIVQFITKALGFPLSAWQKYKLDAAFEECPDCHHWQHSFWYLTGESTPCPHCKCTG